MRFRSVKQLQHEGALCSRRVSCCDRGEMWAIPFIILGGVLQSVGAAMNGQLNKSLLNPWLASAVSFVLVTFFFVGAFMVFPHPLPAARDLKEMPWWAPIGGLVGAVQVYAGLTMVTKVGAGLFVAVTVSSALIASLAIRSLRASSDVPTSARARSARGSGPTHHRRGAHREDMTTGRRWAPASHSAVRR